MDIKIPTLADTIVSNKGRYYGTGDRTWTCTEIHWNLNPTCLPIPPRPRYRYCITPRWVCQRRYGGAVLFMDLGEVRNPFFVVFIQMFLTFSCYAVKIDSVLYALGGCPSIPALYIFPALAGGEPIAPHGVLICIIASLGENSNFTTWGP